MYPIMFAVIIIACLAFLIPHWQLTRRLQRVEQAFAPLEESLRRRLDLIVEWTEALPEEDGEYLAALKELCETARDDETEAMMKAYLKIDKMFRRPEPLWEPLVKNEDELRELGKKYNEETEPYNAMLEKFPWRLYASALLIRKEEKFHLR